MAQVSVHLHRLPSRDSALAVRTSRKSPPPEELVNKAGRLDISFNAISISHNQGTPLVELGSE